jgi:hypothetical protein
MKVSRKITTALKEAGAVLVRDHKHAIYRLPNGATMVVAKSASDHRAEQNFLMDLRRALRGPVTG